jgi:aspartyl aminopeptidase
LKFTMKNVWHKHERTQIEQFSRQYADFMNTARTERMVICETEKMLKEAGFVDIEHFDGTQNKVYAVNRAKSLVAVRLVGKKMPW